MFEPLKIPCCIPGMRSIEQDNTRFMKRIVLLLSLFTAFTQVACGNNPKERGEDVAKDQEVAKATEIHWMSFEEAEKKMKEQPRKVLVDVYTDWCGWCKVMDKKTYTNAALIQYVNEHFYAVKFNAEQKAPITFAGKKWEFIPENRANQLAVELMKGQMSYPTTIIMEEGFKNAQPMPGYMETFQMESVLKYIGGDHHKTTPWNDWQRGFKAEWGK